MQPSRTGTRRSRAFITHDGLLYATGLGVLAALLLPLWRKAGWLPRTGGVLGALALLGALFCLGSFLLAGRSRRSRPEDENPPDQP